MVFQRLIKVRVEGQDRLGARTPIVDRLNGTSLIPGLRDLHTHSTIGPVLAAAQGVDVSDCKSVEAIVARLKEHRDKPVILGYGVDTRVIKAIPKEQLDEISGSVPVILFDPSFHGGWLNTTALRQVQKAAAPYDGMFVGKLTEKGEWKEQAFDFCVEIAARQLGEERVTEGILAWVKRQLSVGVVEMHELDIMNMFNLRCLVNAADIWNRKLPDIPFPVTRVYAPPLVLAGLQRESELAARFNTYFGPLRMKLYADGSIGSRTACLNQPYLKLQESGMVVNSPVFLRWILKGLPDMADVAVHAIGDKGIMTALEIAQIIHRQRGIATSIQHYELSGYARVLDATARLVDREVVSGVSIQPPFVSDCASYVDRLGARVRRINPVAAILKHGIPVNFGTDDVAAGDPAPNMLQALNCQATHPVERSRIPFADALRIASTQTFYAGESGYEVDSSLVVMDTSTLEAMQRTEMGMDQLAAGIRAVVYHGYSVQDILAVLAA